MNFTSDFETLLERTIHTGALSQAKQLLDAFPGTGLSYTLKIYTLTNELHQKMHPFHVLDPNISLGSHIRIVIYLSNNYILNYIAKQFAFFFQDKGCQICFFDTEYFSKSTETLFQCAKKGISAAFFFNHVGLSQLLGDGANLWEKLHVPCYDFVVDHPMYYADSLDTPPTRTTLLCADQTHASYAQKYYPNLESVYFLPTGGCKPYTWPNYSDFLNDYYKRPIDILFIGSYKSVPLGYSSFDMEVLTYLKNNPSVPFDRAIELQMENTNTTEECSLQACKIQIESHRFLETNLTAEYRKNIMETFLKNDLIIHVYGNGWENSGLTKYKNFHLAAPTSFEDGIALMRNAKIVLNHMAWFKEGSSERIFNAMAQGAVCCTDSSLFLDSILTSDFNCITYQLTNESMQNCARHIKNLLSDANGIRQLSQIAYEGWQLSGLHTWESHLALLFPC